MALRRNLGILRPGERSTHARTRWHGLVPGFRHFPTQRADTGSQSSRAEPAREAALPCYVRRRRLPNAPTVQSREVMRIVYLNRLLASWGRVHPLLCAGLLLTGLVIACITVSTENARGATDPPDSRGCEVQDMQSLNAAESARAGEWIESHQKGFRAAERTLDASVADDEGGPLTRVRAGVIGVALDPANEELRVAVDPSIADTDRLQVALDTAVGAVANEPTLQVRVAPGCHSVQAVEDAYAYATSDEWRSPGDDAPAAIGVNAASSIIQVQLGDSTSALSRAALEASGYPALSAVDAGGLELWGTSSDAPPHVTVQAIVNHLGITQIGA